MKFQFLHKNLRDTNYINDYESRSIYKNSTRRRLCGYTSRIDTGLIIFASQPPLAADCRIKRAAMTVSITSLYARSTVPWLASSIFTSETERVEVGGGPGKERSRQIDWSTDAVFAGWIPIMPYYLPSTPSAAIVSYRPGWATLWPPSDTRY